MTRWRSVGFALVAVASMTACSSAVDESNGQASTTDPCKPPDQDGVLGTTNVFERSIDDTEFLPAGNAVIKVQNLTKLTLTIKNVGTKPHDFSVDCLPTPNDNGCPTKSCFPTDATIPSIDPGSSETITFAVPLVEGLYTYRSNLSGDTQTSQFDVD